VVAIDSSGRRPRRRMSHEPPASRARARWRRPLR
jgi:hypothetical protein